MRVASGLRIGAQPLWAFIARRRRIGTTTIADASSEPGATEDSGKTPGRIPRSIGRAGRRADGVRSPRKSGTGHRQASDGPGRNQISRSLGPNGLVLPLLALDWPPTPPPLRPP